MKPINDRIKEFYISQNLSQEEFSNKIGVPLNNTSAVINNRRNVDPSILKKIKDAFPDVDYYWLLTGDDHGSNRKIKIEEIEDSEFVTYLTKKH